MSNIIKQLEQEQMKQDVPSFRPGDTVEVKVWVVEGSKNVCRHSRAWLSLFVTAVCTLHSLFVKFPTAKALSVSSRLTSPVVDSISVKRRGAVRKAKLYYLRERTGKAARIKERLN